MTRKKTDFEQLLEDLTVERYGRRRDRHSAAKEDAAAPAEQIAELVDAVYPKDPHDVPHDDRVVHLLSRRSAS